MPPFRLNEALLQAAIDQRFSCTRSGHCCKGDGLVRFGAAEADAMAAHLGLNRRQFIRKYAYKIDGATWALRDKFEVPRVPPGGPAPEKEQWCVFLEQGRDGLYGCSVNAAKPLQCGSFPHKWRNPDSLHTCCGLRTLVAELRREHEAATAAKATPEPAATAAGDEPGGAAHPTKA